MPNYTSKDNTFKNGTFKNDKSKNNTSKNDTSKLEDSFIELLSVFESETAEKRGPVSLKTSIDTLIATMTIIGKAFGIKIQSPPFINKDNTFAKILEEICSFSRLRFRSVTLNMHWWEEDCGPLLGFRKTDRLMLAMIREKDHYVYIDPETTIKTVIGNETAKEIDSKAYQFFKTFEDDSLNWRNLIKFILPDIKSDMKRIILFGAIAGILALFFPIAAGIIFNSIVPFADLNRLLQITLLLIVLTIVGAFFNLAQNFSLLHLSYKTDVTLQTAVWDRILRLPVTFFRSFTAGDLAYRTRAIDTIQQFMTSAMLNSILIGFFSIISLFLMLYYDVWLTGVAFIAAILAVIISLGFNRIQLKYQRPFIEVQGKLASILYQLLTGMAKIRVSNSENKAFAYWSKPFTEKNKLFLKTQLNNIIYSIFSAFYIILVTILLYAIIIHREHLSLGNIIAFFVAFGQFFFGFLGMAGIINRSLMIVPYYERAKPILNTLPEVENQGLDPGPLTGDIRIQNLSFRYNMDEPNILEDISIDIKSGSFIALVGASGSGKSSLFRLLLAFEEINKETIFYDGNDLLALNKLALRKQIGAVLQNSVIFPGSIYDNITKLDPDLTLNDAIEASQKVAIYDEIMAMPMGMHTLIDEGGGNISVGQRQRILLARALIHNPRILLLDEATNALDNATQAVIQQNLEEMKITRLIASHRISTIKAADCIYVLDRGKIVQVGRYEELIKAPGIFKQLAI